MKTRRPNLLLPTLALFAAALLLSYLGCTKNTANSLSSIRARGELVIGVFGDKPPFGYIDQTGRNVGFDVALARELGRALLGNEKKRRSAPRSLTLRSPICASRLA
jgi:polar amino acid transport system substrate-binding protein